MSENLLLLTDSYKFTHFLQYPPRTEVVSSFFESRGGDFPSTTFFGLQYLLKRHLLGVRVSPAKIAEADAFCTAHFGRPGLFNRAGWEHILKAHHGLLPVRIKAVPEGMTVPTGNVLMTIENTDPAVPWLSNYLETLLVQAWYPTTVCTQSRAMKHIILDALTKTGTPDLLPFKLHDFGFRGSTSVESSAIGGAAHLVNFMGTDTVSALILLRDYYGAPMAGFSIPAAEHSTITSWGKEREADAYENMLRQYPEGLVAVVSDSYDVFHACRELWGQQLRSLVCSRDGTLVVRPDSGDPPSVVVKVLDILGAAFSYRLNPKGYKVLDDHVRVIQGDGIDIVMLPKILAAMDAAGWSADNLAFGSGGGLLQKVNRDTCRFAFKCSAVRIGPDDWRAVMKDPVTDHGKRSKAGRLKLVATATGLLTVPDWQDGADLLEPVFENGVLLRDDDFVTIRGRASGSPLE